MITAITISYLTVALVTGWLLSVGRRGFILNPAFLFLTCQFLMFIGTIPMIQVSSGADLKYFSILFIAFLFSCVGIGYASFLRPVSQVENQLWFDRPIQAVESGPRVELVVYSIIFISVFVCVLYYQAVGYNLFLVAIGNLLAGGSNSASDVGTMRLEFYSDLDNYFAPGYVNQFKNLLLPCMLAFLIARLPYTAGRRALWVIVPAVPLCLVFVLGTGQRFPLVMACGCAALFLYFAVPRKLGKRISSAIAILAIVFFLSGTLILGRGGESESDGSMSVLVADAASRFTGSNQDTGLVGFRFIQGRPITWGRDYYDRIARIIRILPGGRRDLMTIDNEVYAYQYGTPRGTAPMHIWGESWYNFGWFGVILMPFGLGFLYQTIFIRMIQGPKTLARLLVYVNSSVLLGTWVTAGPDYLLNNGLPTILILSYLLRRFGSDTAKSGTKLSPIPVGSATA